MLHSLHSQDLYQLAVIFNYKQVHKKEIDYAKFNCDKLDIPYYVVHMDLPYYGVSLMGGGEIPDGYYTDKSMKQTIVPNRNAIMLAMGSGSRY
jgi:7-cyano-7-deazaguanine synthase